MRFKIDENLPEDLATLFRNAGWDAVTVDEQQLGGTLDSPLERIVVLVDHGTSTGPPMLPPAP